MRAYERTVQAEGTKLYGGLHRRISVTMPERTFLAVRQLAEERRISFAKAARDILKAAAEQQRGRP